jgi:hypothetical protein
VNSTLGVCAQAADVAASMITTPMRIFLTILMTPLLCRNDAMAIQGTPSSIRASTATDQASAG